MRIRGKRIGALTIVHAGKDMVDMIMSCFVSPHSQQQVAHLGTFPQLPVVDGNVGRHFASPLWIASFINVLDCMPAV